MVFQIPSARRRCLTYIVNMVLDQELTGRPYPEKRKPDLKLEKAATSLRPCRE